MGFMASERMKRFLEGLLETYRFEEMRIPLGVLATALCTGEPVSFRDTGDVFLPIRASCSYPGLFQPVRSVDRLLVDGAMSVEIPALLARDLGATHVISVYLPAPPCLVPPADVFQVIRRCFQIMQGRNEQGWRKASDLVITPNLRTIEWDGFESGPTTSDSCARSRRRPRPRCRRFNHGYGHVGGASPFGRARDRAGLATVRHEDASMSLFRHPHLVRGVVHTHQGQFFIRRGLVEAPDEVGESLGWRRVDADEDARVLHPQTQHREVGVRE